MRQLLIAGLAIGLIACDDDSSFGNGGTAGMTTGTTGTTTGTTGTTTGTTGTTTGAGGAMSTAGMTMTTKKRPTGKTTPKPTGMEPAGMPKASVLDDFKTTCFDAVAAEDVLPQSFYLTKVANDATCIEPLTAAGLRAQCDEASAIWLLDFDNCVSAIYFGDCAYGATGVDSVVYVWGEVSPGMVWAQVEAYAADERVLCAWDPAGSDDLDTCVVDEATGQCPSEDCVDDDDNDVCDSEETAGDDSCMYALDNVCDEPADCDYGTDTTDCSL